MLFRSAAATIVVDAGRSRRPRPVLGSGRQIRRHPRSGGETRSSRATPDSQLQQVEEDDAELRRTAPPEKSPSTPNHPPAAPPSPERRRREHHPTLPYVQAGDGDPPPSRCRSSRRRGGIPRLAGEDAVSRRGSPKKSPSPLCYSDGGEEKVGCSFIIHRAKY